MMYYASIVVLVLCHSVAGDNVTISSESTTILTTLADFTTEVGFNVTEAACDANDTSCNATEFSTLPPILRKGDVDEEEDDGERSRYKLSTPKSCHCDLNIDFCDLNCCCDKDCTTNDRKVFTKCIDAGVFRPDTKFCKYLQYIYQNNTVYEWEITQNSLFCIVKSNVPARYYSQAKRKIKNVEEANLQLTHKYLLSFNDEQHQGEDNTSNKQNFSYNYGERLYYMKNKQIVGFEIPDNFVSNMCLTKQPVRYLHDIDTVCSQTRINDENAPLNIGKYYNDVIFARKFNATNCLPNECIPFELYACNSNKFTNCENVTGNNYYKTECNVTKFNARSACKNLVKNVLYEIYHNGSEGIQKVQLYMHLVNMSYDIRDYNFEVKQGYAVRFYWHKNITFLQRRSGNPGYINGKPILTAVSLTLLNTTHNASKYYEIVQRNSSNFVDNFLVVPSSVKGECRLDNKLHHLVEFAHNFIAKCRLKSNPINQKMFNSSATQICKRLQFLLVKNWNLERELSNVTRLLIGNFGNANASNAKEWSGIIYERTPRELINSTDGVYTNDNRRILCRNVSSTMRMSVFYAREEYKNDNNQAKIAGTFVQFIVNDGIELSLRNGAADVDVWSKVEVMFHDITAKKVQKYVDPPSLRIKLPYDFFYPFVKIENNGGGRLQYNGYWTLLLFGLWFLTI